MQMVQKYVDRPYISFKVFHILYANFLLQLQIVFGVGFGHLVLSVMDVVGESGLQGLAQSL